MSFQDQGEKILRELGLTFSQAKVYIALVRSGGQSTVRTVSESSNTARQDVYRTMAKLRQLGIVETVVANPQMFRPIPMQEVIFILVERRRKKTNNLLTEAKELMTKFPEKEAEANQNSQFVVIPSGKAITSRLERTLKATQESMVSVSPWREFKQWMDLLPELWSQALKRGVTFRWITGKPENGDTCPEIIQASLKSPHFKLRIIRDAPKEKFAIHDGKEVFIAISEEPNAAESPALWTNNHLVVSMLKGYFEMKWQLAEEYKPGETWPQEKDGCR